MEYPTLSPWRLAAAGRIGHDLHSSVSGLLESSFPQSVGGFLHRINLLAPVIRHVFSILIVTVDSRDETH